MFPYAHSSTETMIFELIITIFAVIIASLVCVHLLYPSIWRDLYTVVVAYRTLRNTKNSWKKNELVIDTFEEQVRRQPKRPFIVFNDETQTYRYVDTYASQVARALLDVGIQAGDTVALVMSNEPAFVWIYLGVQKIGARISLVNHHLVSDGLLHSLTSCAPKLIIVGDGLDTYLPKVIATLLPQLSDQISVYSFNRPHEDVPLPSFRDLMDSQSPYPIGKQHRSNVQLTDPAAFIYTSGTTGFPKPAIITHKKCIHHSNSYSPFGFSSRDVLYLPLPLYHASAINLALLNVINVGASIVLKDKFSVSSFWSDCVAHQVTSVQYIGEMLRYLVNAPTCPEETQHHLTSVIGNGLREDIWIRFKSRFKIPNIYEFYGSTELPAGTINMFNVPGSVGRLSPILSKLMHIIVVKVDPKTEEPLRNSKGRCFVCRPGDSGVLLAQLSNKVTFEGYVGPASYTNSRIIKDVLREGDFYVNTNDVFYLDKQYNLFFKERIGDSFRWKGESVSAAEVTRVLNSADFIQDTNVFGVHVPGCEGTAGMAAINLKDEEDLSQDRLGVLGQKCRQNLPGYARPRFLRVQRQMSLTTTFKQQKTELVKEGFDPKIVTEPLYYLDRKDDCYRPLDEETYNDIVNGRQAL